MLVRGVYETMGDDGSDVSLHVVGISSIFLSGAILDNLMLMSTIELPLQELSTWVIEFAESLSIPKRLMNAGVKLNPMAKKFLTDLAS